MDGFLWVGVLCVFMFLYVCVCVRVIDRERESVCGFGCVGGGMCM